MPSPESQPILEKTQEQLRESLEKRLNTITADARTRLDAYDKDVEKKVFDDKDNEEAGSGDKRKELAQSKIAVLIERAERMKETLNSKEELPQTTPSLDVDYTYTNPTTKKVEHQETITLDIEQKTKEFLDFYKKTGLEVPTDFAETIADIWERNAPEIEQAIEQNGFDDILIIPANIPLPELAEKMKMENGYYFYQVSKDFSNVQSQNVDKPRIILYHHMDTLPEIVQKTGLDIHLNITGADMEKLFKADPDKYLSTLEDALVLERKYFEDTGKHPSSWKMNSAQWLPGSKSGVRLVNSYWYPGDGKLDVNALDLGYRIPDLGARPSRSFF